MAQEHPVQSDRSPGQRPLLLCWIGRGQQPGEYFAAEDVARLKSAADVRFVRVEKGQTVSDEQTIRESSGADAAIFAWDTVVYRDAVLERCPRLRFLARFGGSVRDLIGLRAWDQGIRVVAAVEAMGRMIAELTVAMILAGQYRLMRHYELQKAPARLEFDAGSRFGQRSLYGKNVALVGFGTIARHVARLLTPFGCSLLAYDPHVGHEVFAAAGVKPVGDLQDLVRQADILSLHAPHIPATQGMINRSLVASLKRGALVVNTAWAELVDMAALEERVLAGELVACLDNVDLMYGPGSDSIQVLRQCPDSLITTIIGMHGDCIHLMGRQLVDEAIRFFRGETLQHEIRRETLDNRG